ncbi:MAG: hypothetical protein KDC38_14640 [Planctomycetes bacterium]|nr:hypothetical protein [Planctomycetota bacterium]
MRPPPSSSSQPLSDFAHELDHRPPILCLDRCVHCDADTAITETDLGPSAHLCDGEFWEGGLIEGLAQTTALLQGRATRRPKREPGLLVGLKRFTFHRCPQRGETVRFEVRVVRDLPPMTLVDCRAFSGAELLAEGTMKFYLPPDSNDEGSDA